jgi:hypothetical protein
VWGEMELISPMCSLCSAECSTGCAVTDSAKEQLLLAISEAVVSRKEDPKTVKIRGTMQNIEILVLIDLESSNSFISD